MVIFKRVLFWGAFCVFLLLGTREANKIGQFSPVSLRFDTPVCGEAAHRARQFSIYEGDTFWPTFWSESQAELSAGARTAYVNAISFSGDATLVWPTTYIAGTAPGSVDINGIAVSYALAHRLWGSIDIIGQTVYVEESSRIVRGVFEGSTELALISFHIEDVSQSWTVVELSGGMAHPTRRDAEQFAIFSGLGAPDYVIMGGALALARFVSLLPVLVLAAHGAVWIFIQTPTSARYAGLIMIALSLPLVLNALPPWLIPNRWSDFSFWANLTQNANDGIREFFGINPTLRDVELKIHLLRQMVIGVIGAMLATTQIAALQARQKYGVGEKILNARGLRPREL
ncbi:MAG: hypothetical protein FWF78_10195 [Defluviitaleaceae bacterium]|nr:hypothetical protein [Defluviitaleaceae bacterium]